MKPCSVKMYKVIPFSLITDARSDIWLMVELKLARTIGKILWSNLKFQAKFLGLIQYIFRLGVVKFIPLLLLIQNIYSLQGPMDLQGIACITTLFIYCQGCDRYKKALFHTHLLGKSSLVMIATTFYAEILQSLKVVVKTKYWKIQFAVVSSSRTSPPIYILFKQQFTTGPHSAQSSYNIKLIKNEREEFNTNCNIPSPAFLTGCFHFWLREEDLGRYIVRMRA